MTDVQTRWIDVHHHIVPRKYVEALARLGTTTAGGATLPDWTLAASLSAMDRLGVAATMLSLSSPGAHSESEKQTLELADICNNELGDIVAGRPDRFGAFAVLPLPHIDAAMKVLEQLPPQFDGIGLIASYGDRYLGDPHFAPVFDELNRRKAIVFIHPTIGPGSEAFDIGVLPAAIEFPFDTTRTAVSLLRGGVLHRCPDIRFILAHNGGTVPFLAGRIASMIERRLPYKEFAPHGVSHYLKRLFYECTTSTSPATLACVRAFVADTQVLFGTDYPFAPDPVGARGQKDISDFDGFSPQNRQRIAFDNAAALFPRLSR